MQTQKVYCILWPFLSLTHPFYHDLLPLDFNVSVDCAFVRICKVFAPITEQFDSFVMYNKH